MWVVLGFVIRHGTVCKVEAGVARAAAGNGVGNGSKDWLFGGDWTTDKLTIPPDGILQLNDIFEKKKR